jgi:pimeloyl-ACP methyl ester carboxylesterase
MKLLARVRLPADVDVAGVSHHAVFLKGFTAHVAHAGKGEPVIMLHGWPQHWWAWRHLIGPLAADGRSLICPDLRGFGWSSTPAAGYSADQFAADLLKLLDVLELERVDLVAHDWGAVTGFLACLQAPERFGRFIAISAPSPHLRVTPKIAFQMWRYWYQLVLGSNRLGPRAVRGLSSPRSRVARWIGMDRLQENEREVYLRQFEDEARVRATIALYRHSVRQLLPRPLTGRYRRASLKVPTLVVHGMEDRPTHPSLIAGIEARAERMEVEILPGVGHFLLDEAPQAVLQQVRAFLSS